MSNNEKIEIRFEPSAIYSHAGCDVAYGRLYLNDMSIPALRMCLGMYMLDLPLKVDGDSLLIIEKAPYCVQIPPYRYVTYLSAPHVLYFISSWGAKRAFCSADVKICNKLPAIIREATNIEYIYTTLKSALVNGET